ncbi:rRNA methyltransferase [Pseudoclavibacter endophyticus]|nr:rRNA methyltransferase [Pseudoclavibacter endophyticus]
MRVIPISNLGADEFDDGERPAYPGLSDYVGLTDVALRRRLEPEGGLYLAESPKVIARAIAAGHRPRSVLLQEQWLDGLAPTLEAFPDLPVYVGSSALLEQLTGFRMHRGALASMHRPELPEPADLLRDARTVLVLEDIVDHTNVGAAFRAAAGLGADAVLVTERCADPLYRRSVRVSMGTVLQVPWTRLPHWDASAAVLREHGFSIAALALDDGAVSLRHYAAHRPERVALVLGTEGDGLSRRALHHADATVMIPMRHGVDSLNVAAASAVALYALQEGA